jgi:hypothetical protein
MISVTMSVSTSVSIPALGAIAAGLLLAACGQVSEAGEPGEPSVGGPDDAVTVTQALAAPEDRTLRVAGSLLWDGDRVQLCDALAESYPPQCTDGAVLQGWDPAQIPPDLAGVRVVEGLEVVVRRVGDVLVAVTETDRP